MIRRSLLSFLPSTNKKSDQPTTTSLDLCFICDEHELRAAWDQVPELAHEADSFDSLCNALWRCAERPSALSIAHAGAEKPVLPTILAHLQQANNVLSSATDVAEGGGASRTLPWRECGAAVALVHAAARLFVPLSATPQYRLLLLQHDLPTHIRLTIARLADGLQALNGGGGDGRSGDAIDDESAPALAMLHTLQLCTLLLGCLWQAGFAALHAHEGLRAPTLPRLADSVEGLLRAPNATLGLGGSDAASDAASNGGGGGVEAQATTTGASSGDALASQQHRDQTQQLLRLLRLSHAQREEYPPGSACWSTAARLQRLSAAVLGVVLPASPASVSALLTQHGVSALLLCLTPHETESFATARRGARGSAHPEVAEADVASAEVDARRCHRQLLQLELQCLLVALICGAPPDANEWRAQWIDAGGTFLMARMIRRVGAAFSGGADGDGVPENGANPTPTATVAALPADRGAAERVLALAAAEVGPWSGGMGTEQLTEWWQGVQLSPLLHATSATEYDAELMPMVAAVPQTAMAAEAATAKSVPELALVFSFLRQVCDTCEPPPTAAPSSVLRTTRGSEVRDSVLKGRDETALLLSSWSAGDEPNETRQAIIGALLEAAMPQPTPPALHVSSATAADFGGGGAGLEGSTARESTQAGSMDSTGSMTSASTAAWYLQLLGIIREFGVLVVVPSATLMPRAVQLLSSAHFARSRDALGSTSEAWPPSTPLPPPLAVSTCRLSTAGEAEILASGDGMIESLAPIPMLAVHHLCALVMSPRLHPDAIAPCAAALLGAFDAQLREMISGHAGHAAEGATGQSLDALRALWHCYCELIAALHARTPPQPPLPMEPAGQLPPEWDKVLSVLARLLSAVASLPGTPVFADLSAMICSACERTVCVPFLSRWALQQTVGPTSLFVALIDMAHHVAPAIKPPSAPASSASATASAAAADPSPTTRFALRHAIDLLRHAALECRLEGELQGQHVVADDPPSSLPAWAIGVRLYGRYVELLAPSAGCTRGLRSLLLDGLDRVVHAEAAALQEGASWSVHPQAAIGESFSQRLLRECGVWVHLFAALDAEAAISTPSFVDLLLHVLEVLPMLTWGAPSAQAAFASAVGHEKMLQLLLLSGKPVGQPVIARVFDWFAGAPAQVDHECAARTPLGTRRDRRAFAWSAGHASIVQVGEVSSLLLALLPQTDDELQLAMLQRLGTLLDASILNRSRGSELRLLRGMLQLLLNPLSEATQRALLRALTPLASHSVSVSELKLLFGLLAHQPTEATDGGGVLHAELLSTIASMLRQHGPAASFIFDGHHSGLLLPPLPKLPTAGYTFCAWIRINSFLPPATAHTQESTGAHAHAAPNGTWSPRLLSLRDDHGRGLELVFVRERAASGGRASDPNGMASLHLRTLGASPGGASAVVAGSSFAAVQTLEFKHTFKTGRWYHVAIAHEGSRMFAKSHATLYVDGKVQHSGALKYPAAERLTCGFLGTNYATPGASVSSGGRRALPDHGLPSRERAQALCGQVGAAFLFAEAIDHEQIQSLWALGYSYDWAPVDRGESSSSVPSGGSSGIGGGGGGGSGAPEHLATAPMLLALNPKSRDGEEFPNNAALSSIDVQASSSLASTARGSSVNGAPPQSAVLSVGSHACVTHTVRDSAQCLGGVQLLFPLLARLPAQRTEGAVGLKAEQLLVQVLALMSQMLWDSDADQHFMLRRHGFAIFVFLLRQLPPAVWTVQAVTSCVQLTSCFASSESLHHEAVWLLFGAPRLWIFTSLEVQLEVYDVLQAVIERKPRAFVTPSAAGDEPLLSVQALLDLIEIYYWHQPSTGSFARQPLLHAVSGEVMGERPKSDGLRKLRGKVLGLLQVLAEAELSRADAQCLVAVLRSCRDARVLIDVLKLLMGWLTPGPNGLLGPCGAALVARLTELAQLSEEDMYDTLVDLMHGDYELLRLAALRLLGMLLAAAPATLQPPPAIWPRVTHALGGTALSQPTYSALLDTLLGKPQSVTLDINTLPAERIRHPQLLGTVIQLLSTATYDTQRQALAHLTQLCRLHRSNCDALLELPGWQRWLLQLIRPQGDQTQRQQPPFISRAVSAPGGILGGASTAAVDGTDERLLPMLQRLMQVLHAHALLHRPSGWRTVQQSLGYVRIVLSQQDQSAAPQTSPPGAPPTAAASVSMPTSPRLGASDGSEDHLLRSVPRGMLEGLATMLVEELPGRCAGVVNTPSTPPLWAENIEQLLTCVKRFVFDEQPDRRTYFERSEGSRSPVGGRTAATWHWVHELSPALDPADLALISTCLDLLNLLGVAVTAAPPAHEWGPVRAAWTAYSEAQVDHERRLAPRRTARPPVAAVAIGNVDATPGSPAVVVDVTDGDESDEARTELEGGLYWLALCFLVRTLAATEISQPSWSACHARLGRLLQLLQPATHGQAHRVKKTASHTMRRQRLQALCGRWQSGLLERQCQLLLATPTGAAQHAPMQGALLYTLAWLQALVVDGFTPPSASSLASGMVPLDAAASEARKSSLEALSMTVMTLFEPYPFAPQQRVTTVRDLYSGEWRQACSSLLKQVMRASHEAHIADADAAVALNGGVLMRLRSSHERQQQREAAELQHGSELWQNRMVVLHEEEVNRRDELVRTHGQQERQVARLWLKLQRRLTHQRAPWALTTARGEADAVESFWRLSKWENELRMRCRLKSAESGTRHPEASKHRVSGEEEAERRATPSGGGANDKALLLPTGVHLAKLCEGSDGEEWEKADKKALTTPQREDAQALTPRESPAGAAVGAVTEETRRPTHEVECDLITAQRVIKGTLQLFSTRLVFLPNLPAYEKDSAAELAKWEEHKRGERPLDKPPREKEWSLSSLYEVHRRRYLLRACALELFFHDAPAIFVNLRKKPARRRLANRLQSACPRAQLISPKESKWVLELCASWRERRISNFAFLQRLNTLAGRTYNDLNQYPVFPWVVSDYASEQLDLTDPATFRDLSKPMGAQRDERCEEVRVRFETLQELSDSGIGIAEGQPPPFHYGSHYSSAAIVMHYLIRLEPFTTLAIRLQGGFFDHADRLFHSIGTTYEHATTNTADVKELIPELFYLPEGLHNNNGVGLGVRQDGTVLDDVKLPPWASDANDFIAKHREALESEYVSAHLHEWVDLIFGYKQTGAPAIAALNVFYYLTYEGAIDLDAIDDPRERAATEAQISHFGNTPTQLLTRPLSARKSPDAVAHVPIGSMPSDHARLLGERQISRAPVLAIALSHDRLVGVGADRRTASLRWASGALVDGIKGHALALDPNTSERRHAFGVPFVEGLLDLPGGRFAASADGRHLYSCGYWDRSVKCTHVADGRTAQSLRAHTDVVSCLALTRDGTMLVTGSRDTTLMVWPIASIRGSSAAPLLSEKPRHVLHGHDDEVTCVEVSAEGNTVLSGSLDGSAIVYSLRSGQYIRTIPHPTGAPVHLVALSSSGWIALCSLHDRQLHSCTVNHRPAQPPLASCDVGERLAALCFAHAGDVLLTAGDSGVVRVRRPHDLSVLHELHATSDESPGGPGPLRCLALSAVEDCVLAGTQRGTLLVWTTTNKNKAAEKAIETDSLLRAQWVMSSSNPLHP